MALHFEVVSPEKVFASGEAEMVQIPGSEGEMGIMAGSAPLLVLLKPGVVTITRGGAREQIFVRGGFAEVNAKGLTVLADLAMPLADFNGARLDAEIKAAEDTLALAKSDDAKFRAQETLEQIKGLKALH